MVRRIDSPPYIIDTKSHGRFDQRQTVFGRMLFDTKADFYERGMYENLENVRSCEKEGYSRVDFARLMGAWSVYDYFHGAFSWEKLVDATSIMEKPELERLPVDDPAAMSQVVKETAVRYGASLVGITRLDHRWIYSHNRDGDPIEIPEECRFAIIMAIRMDRAAIRASPTFNACIETALGYSRMAFCIGCMAEFIRYLGYSAVPMGNDTSLSIPLAMDAGLGELGRNGLLITPEHGPCVRICKVFTDLPLETDRPVEFGVPAYCRKCNRCAEACEADAIRKEEEPSFETVCPSNNTGIRRWAVDHDSCYRFWLKNGGECSNCIAACPFVPGEDG